MQSSLLRRTAVVAGGLTWSLVSALTYCFAILYRAWGILILNAHDGTEKSVSTTKCLIATTNRITDPLNPDPNEEEQK